MTSCECKVENRKESYLKLLSGVLLIAGTSIGAGMLALPVVTGVSGFIPALAVSTLCWIFMLITGLLFLEVTLWMPKDSNLLSMAGRFLGPWGQWIGGISFLFLYYCLMVSYLAGGAPLFSTVLKFGGIQLSSTASFLLFAAFFGAIAFIGTRLVNRVNGILMIGLIVSYFFLIAIGTEEINYSWLSHRSWGLSLFAAPTLFSAYGYHNIIPSLTTYMNRDVKKLRWAIIIGTAIPFIVYSLWQFVIIGNLTLEDLEIAKQEGAPISQVLGQISNHPYLPTLGLLFGFFALVTSLLGVSLSMIDFLRDGMNVPNTKANRIGLTVLTFAPPALFASLYPHIFITAISVAGGFGEAILNGLLPILMFWIGRYIWKLPAKSYISKFSLSILLAFTGFIICLEIYQLIF
jgi:tyrosine-specific transport protein